jgi:hypothetical protein
MVISMDTDPKDRESDDRKNTEREIFVSETRASEKDLKDKRKSNALKAISATILLVIGALGLLDYIADVSWVIFIIGSIPDLFLIPAFAVVSLPALIVVARIKSAALQLASAFSFALGSASVLRASFHNLEPLLVRFVHEHTRTKDLVFLPIFVAVLYGLFVIRCNGRRLYGALEIAFGFLGAYLAYNASIKAFSASTDSDIWGKVVSLIAALYVVIRGLNNFEEGMRQQNQDGKAASWWVSIFYAYPQQLGNAFSLQRIIPRRRR